MEKKITFHKSHQHFQTAFSLCIIHPPKKKQPKMLAFVQTNSHSNPT